MGGRGRGVVVVLLIQTLLPVCLSVIQDLARVRMSQHQSCYFQPHNKELVCQCRMGEDKSYLHLKLQEFMLQAGQEIKSILVHSCPDLLLHLNFLGVNPNIIETVVKNSQNIRLEAVTVDKRFKDRQQIKLAFLNIGTTTLSSFSISEAAKMTVTNVKEFNILNCSFSHLPVRGLVVNRADKLVIKDSRFARVYPKSMVLEKTRVVEVVNNQFSVEAIQVISYKEGSSVFISCNRLLGDFIKPECFTTTTDSTTTLRSTTTTTTSTTATTTTSTPATTRSLPSPSQPQQSPLVTILVILIIILLLVMLLVISAICVINWTKIKKQFDHLSSPPPTPGQKDDEEPLHVVAVPAPPPPPPPVEMESLLNPQHCAKQQLFAPVWMDEIQNNKIFNRQKSINQELEGCDEQKEDTLKKQDENDKDDISHDADYKENSRTESDQDDI